MPRSRRSKNTAAAHRDPRAAAQRELRASADRDSSAAAHRDPPAANLKDVAEYLGLSSATVSMVMNRSPAAKSIPLCTQERVRAAARQLNYRPNFMAKSLRQKRSFTVGVIVPEISEGYGALVMSGIEDHLLQEGYFYYVVSHRHRKDLIEEYPRLLQLRSVEGIIAVDTPCQENKSLRVVAVSGHQHVPGVTNILLDHALAAKLALEHLYALGHRKIAFIKGQEFSSDTAVRWKTVQESAAHLGLKIDAALVAQLVGEVGTPELGYYCHATAARNAPAVHRAFCLQRYFRDGRDPRAGRSETKNSRRRFRRRLRRHPQRRVPKSGAHHRPPAAPRNGRDRRRNFAAKNHVAGQRALSRFDHREAHAGGARQLRPRAPPGVAPGNANLPIGV